MVTNRKRPTDDELAAEREAGMALIRQANIDLADRAVKAGMRFQLDSDGALRATIGEPSLSPYMQRIGGVRFSIDSQTHEVVGFVIDDFGQYIKNRPDAPQVFRTLLPALESLGVISLPPQASRIEGLREGLQELLSA